MTIEPADTVERSAFPSEVWDASASSYSYGTFRNNGTEMERLTEQAVVDPNIEL